MEYLIEYRTAILVVGLVGLMMFVQLVIADVVAIMKKHVPGYPIETDHDQFIFRASRAYMNTNESVVIFVLFLIFSILSSADASIVNMSALGYLGSRIAHMIFYYLDFKFARSTAFGVSLFSLLVMFIAGIINWL